MSTALSPAHAQASEAVLVAAIRYVDETGWKQHGSKRWLWVAATPNLAVFLIHRLRNVTALRKFVGATQSGILSSDRWRAYDEVPLQRRQDCWAHLKQNWEKLVERGGKICFDPRHQALHGYL
jgi:transposase